MYECSCVDFAVHATVCKHVHTIHQLRCTNNADSSQSFLIDAAAVVASNDVSAQSADIEDDNMSIEADAPSVEGPSASVDIEALRRRAVSKCQQHYLAEITACNDSAALQCVLKQANTSMASLRAIARRRSTKIPTARRLAANKKLDRQLWFYRTKKKRQYVATKLQKPSVDKVSAVKNAIMHVANDTTHSFSTDTLSASVTYAAVSYCVDTEEVTITSPHMQHC